MVGRDVDQDLILTARVGRRRKTSWTSRILRTRLRRKCVVPARKGEILGFADVSAWADGTDGRSRGLRPGRGVIRVTANRCTFQIIDASTEGRYRLSEREIERQGT